MSEDWRDNGPLDKAAEMAARGARAAGQAERIAQAVQSAHGAMVAAGAASAGGAAGGMAVGSALAGPLGAAVGALVTSKTFWKVVLSILLSVLLFVFVIVNGVGIILAYLGFGDADGYVAQAREAEYRNIKNQIDTLLAEDSQLAEEIYGLIGGERDSLYGKIGEDFDENWEDYDGYEVETDEYERVLKPKLSRYLAVLIEEEWSGSRIVGFNGYGSYGGMDGNLTSVYDEYFALAAATYQVPEALLKAMAKVESDFNPNAVSGAGAVGIMQLMPATARNLGVTDPYDPKQNIMGGAKYIQEMLRTFSAYPNGLDLALAAYNAGPGAVKRAGYRIPQNGETPAYVEKVKGYLIFTDMVQGNGNGGLEGEGSGEADGNGGNSGETGGVETGGEIQGAESGNGDGTGEAGIVSGSLEVSGVLLKSLVEDRASEFLGWTQTGTHTETEGSGDDEVEREIVDYAIVVLLEPELSEVKTGYEYRMVTDQTSFNYVLTLFQIASQGAEGVQDLVLRAASWKNFVLGEGASEDIYTGTISTEGDRIAYDTVAGCVGEAVYYNQGEEPWASLPYGGSNIRSSGCGPTALAIVISTLTGERVTPEMTGRFAISGGYYVKGKGTSHAFPAAAAAHWGLSVERMKRERMNEVVKGLKNGKMAVVICAENTISGSSGHYIVLTGVTENGYLTIADPGSRTRTGNLYSPATIQSYARDLADGSIWLIGK